jgi:hypothetical protein
MKLPSQVAAIVRDPIQSAGTLPSTPGNHPMSGVIAATGVQCPPGTTSYCAEGQVCRQNAHTGGYYCASTMW